jgi:hypothetical protein
MGGFPILGPMLRSLRESRKRKLIEAARAWPTVEARVNGWHVINADTAIATAALSYQIEATFSFQKDGEYFGGYFLSVPMTHHQAETLGVGEATIIARSDPTDPNRAVVLAEENAGRLPFEIISG